METEASLLHSHFDFSASELPVLESGNDAASGDLEPPSACIAVGIFRGTTTSTTEYGLQQSKL
eukprot:2332265-Rhodomonas_salina.1